MPTRRRARRVGVTCDDVFVSWSLGRRNRDLDLLEDPEASISLGRHEATRREKMLTAGTAANSSAFIKFYLNLFV